MPEEDILAHGTADPLADVATQARLSDQVALSLEATPKSATPGDWGPVYGELLTFNDPSTRLPAIDRLEGFHPGGPSLYRRVLVYSHLFGGVLYPSWCYVLNSHCFPLSGLRQSPSGRWNWRTGKRVK